MAKKQYTHLRIVNTKYGKRNEVINEGMSLPTVRYKGKTYFVDFKLGEMRSIGKNQPIKFIRFVDLTEDKNSEFKKSLRKLRAYTWYNEYVRGIDD